MKKVLLAVLALSFMAVSSGLVLADGTAPAATPKKKHHLKHHKKHAAKAVTTAVPAATPAK
jgi:hypothetical protein